MPNNYTGSALVHLGFPKALSSWLQKHLFRPDCGFITVLDPMQVQQTLIDPAPFAYHPGAAAALIAERLTGSDSRLVPVITSESLSGNMYCGGYDAKQCFDRVIELAPAARVLLIVREQRSVIRSLYKSMVVWGMPHSIDRLLNPVQPRLAPQFNLDYLRYDQRVAYYQKRLGVDRVRVLSYEAFRANPQEFLVNIAAFARVKAEFHAGIRRTPVEHTVNPGQTLANLQLQRWSNRFLLSGPFNYGGLFKPTPTSWERRVRRSRRNRLPDFMDNWFERGFARKVQAHTAGLFADSNRRLQQLTGLDLSRYGYEL